jgi:hypothetical protein
MKNKIKITLLLLLVWNFGYTQKAKLDTLKMFEGHWVFKMAMNTDYTQQELEDTYLKDVRGRRIHIRGLRIYGNFNDFYDNYLIKTDKLRTFSKKSYKKFDDLNQKDFIELEKKTIKINQQVLGIYYPQNFTQELPYFGIQYSVEQDYLKIGIDQTMFFLERDKSEYKFIGVIETLILGEDKKPTLNKILENEEVEILEKGKEYSKIRYWGKALIIGWVKTMDLKDGTSHPEYWNIYKENSIKFKVLSTKSFIYDNLFQKTNSYLIKGDTLEVLEEKGFYLKIKYNNIIGLIPRIDVEGYNTFRLTKSKIILYTSPNLPTKMYLLKGDDVELIDREGDWLKIRFRGKRVVEGWLKRSDVE